MIKCNLSRPDGTIVASFDFPTQAKEVTYSDYVAFETAYEAKEEWLKENDGKSFLEPEFMASYIRHVAHIVEAFTKQKVLEAALGDYMQHVSQFYGDDTAAILKELHAVENTVFTLYANIWKTIATYKKHVHTGEAYRFLYKGKQYSLKASYRDAITGVMRFESVSVAQGVESLEAWDIYLKAMGNDPKKRFLFTTIITLIACLALEEGQQFPDKEKEIQKWVSERTVYFKDIDMETALNVRDFFLLITNPYGKTQNISGSSVPPLIPKNIKAKNGKSIGQRMKQRRRG